MKKERLAMGGAVLSALAASLCCVGPLLFVVLGLGAFSAATVLDTARPFLLAAAVLLLAFGFYRTYFRREAACAPGEACATKPINRASRAGLWLASIAVITFALSPYYAGAVARRFSAKPPPSNSQAQATAQPAVARATFKVSGMTCSSCETTIKLALERTPGVRRSEVSYDRREAIVEYEPNATSVEKLREAINQTGYTAEVVR